MKETLRCYGKVLREWRCTTMYGGHEVETTCQYEVAYREYDTEGNLVAKGSEDFSPERYWGIKHYRIFTWNGEQYNKGGCRWFQRETTVSINRHDRKKLVDVAAKWYPTAAVVNVR